MKLARITAIKSGIKQQWLEEWKRGRDNAGQLRNMSQRPHTVLFGAEIYNGISIRKHVAWLVRLRTGHVSLNQYLHRFNIIDNPTCQCEDGLKTVKHFLLTCVLYEKERETLRHKVRVQGMRVETLLGDPKNIRDTIEYLEAMGRFNF